MLIRRENILTKKTKRLIIKNKYKLITFYTREKTNKSVIKIQKRRKVNKKQRKNQSNRMSRIAFALLAIGCLLVSVSA